MSDFSRSGQKYCVLGSPYFPLCRVSGRRIMMDLKAPDLFFVPDKFSKGSVIRQCPKGRSQSGPKERK